MPFTVLVIFVLGSVAWAGQVSDPPNIVLVMTDDQGYGQTGYYGHPILKTPHLDAMAAAGLRLDRFYAGAPNCSPTRATVLTGRTNDRTGVFNHGHALRLQERVLPRALRDAGYATGHFGKWHLNGFVGPGVPILPTDDHHPGHFGFEKWVSVSNFFERDPLMSRNGTFEEFEGDSSEVIVEEALIFMESQVRRQRPFFVLIWYGSPHSPWIASDSDRAAFDDQSETSQHHHGELVAMDRSVGALRAGLRRLGVAENTLVWFNSDNGGLPGIQPGTVGSLRGFKGSLYEGGLRVPAIIEWPVRIQGGRTSLFPASTVDIFPTLVEAVGLPKSVMLEPRDGMSLMPLFAGELKQRPQPLGFRHTGRSAWIDLPYKLVAPDRQGNRWELYDLEKDESESTDLIEQLPEVAQRMMRQFKAWNESVDHSRAGRDYPEGRVSPDEPPSRQWMASEEYAPYMDELYQRPEYRTRIDRARAQRSPR